MVVLPDTKGSRAAEVPGARRHAEVGSSWRWLPTCQAISLQLARGRRAAGFSAASRGGGQQLALAQAVLHHRRPGVDARRVRVLQWAVGGWWARCWGCALVSRYLSAACRRVAAHQSHADRSEQTEAPVVSRLALARLQCAWLRSLQAQLLAAARPQCNAMR